MSVTVSKSKITVRAIVAVVLLMAVAIVSAADAKKDISKHQTATEYLQSLSASSGEPMEIYYDYVEGGVLSGGTLEVEPPSFSAAQVLTETPSYNSYTLVDNGSSANRIDLVFVGDGYTATQMGLYAQHVQNIVNGFFQEPPLDHYASFFNVYVVEVISNESGVDEVDKGIVRDTALDMAFDNDQQLNVDYMKTKLAAGNAPATDVVIALANSARYGGVGYSGVCTVSGGYASVVELTLHEFGHAFAGLADEYYSLSDPDYEGEELTQPNVSIYTADQQAAQKVKWYRWLDISGINTYQGAKSYQSGIYRPVNITKMRALGYPYGPVNSEQFVFKIYNATSPIDQISPLSETPKPAETVFTVSCQTPVPDTLEVSWQIDDVMVTGAAAKSFCPADFAEYLIPNTLQTLTVNVIDETNLIRDESRRAALMSDQQTWQIWKASADLASSGLFGLDYLCGMASRWLTDDPVYDIAPDDGDGIVDMQDFSSLAAIWDGSPVLQPDGVVDTYDLMSMAGSWLTNDSTWDVAPAGGDDIVNMLDFTVMAAQWTGL